MAGATVLALACLSLLAESRQTARQAPGPAPGAPQGRPIKVLFVGSDQDAPHNPERMFPLLAAPLARRGIQLTYGRSPAEALESSRLSYYDAIMLYGDRMALTSDQQAAIARFVEDGHGVIALHAVGDLSLVGTTLQPQGGAEFTAEIVQPPNPVVQGLEPFATWEEPVASAPPAGTASPIMAAALGSLLAAASFP